MDRHVITPSPAEAPVETRLGWKSAVVGGLTSWLLARAVITAAATASALLGGGHFRSDPLGVNRPDNGGSGFFAALHHWDSGFFTRIATDGYFAPDATPGTLAFFPGFPMAARVGANVVTLGHPTPGAVAASMWTLNALASLVATVVLWRIVEIVADPALARLSTVLLVGGPYGVFLAANYSEALFLLGAITAWYFGVTQRWWWCGLCCFVATATRINGVFLVAALLCMYVLDRRSRGTRALSWSVLWVPIAVAGVAGYFTYLALHTGELFAWSKAQSAVWHRELSWPWVAFFRTGGHILYASSIDQNFQNALDMVFAGLLLLAVMVWARRRQWPEVVYGATTLLALTTSYTFLSLARNSLTVFPAVILLAGFVQAGGPTRKGLVLVPWLGLFVVNTVLFAFGYWTD